MQENGAHVMNEPERRHPARQVRRELLLAGILIPAGLFFVPMAIFFTGQTLLGSYSEDGQGIGHLYGDIFGDLAAGSLFAWLLVLSPWLGVQLLRLAILPLRRRPEPEVSEHNKM